MLDAVLTVEKLSSNRIGLDDMHCACYGIDAWRRAPEAQRLN